MNIHTSPKFKKALKKTVKKNPRLKIKIKSAIQLLQDNPENPKLKLHKLTSTTTEDWSISVSYKIRITFHYENNCIVLSNIGTHDQVY